MSRAAVGIDLAHEADVGAARRAAALLAVDAGLDERRAGDLALVVTELAANVVRHAGFGGVWLSAADGGAPGVDVVVWDRGPGMDVQDCLRDGMSTAGTRGVGLGAVDRLASRWDTYSRRGGGTVVVATVYATAPAPDRALSSGGLCVPYPGEDVAGDGWELRAERDARLLIVCDGLGHGHGAAQATAAVLRAFRATASDSPAALLEAAHAAARATRGAAATVARIDLARDTVTLAGVGNVTPWLIGDAQRQLVTQYGTLGQALPRLREESYPFPPGTLLVLCSDGIKSRWDLSGHPGLAARGPATIAATLWRDFARGKDDATVVVARAA